MCVETDAWFWLVLELMILLFPMGFLMGLLLAALIHELGHLLAVRLMGGEALRIRLRAGGARMETSVLDPVRTAVCALAGPAAGVLCVLAWRWFPELAVAGAVQSIFNLLPVPPLDGWVLLSCIFRRKRN